MEPQSSRPERMGISELNRLSECILGAAFTVHTGLGPGLLESAYEACLEYELRSRGLAVERQKTLPVRYKEVLVDAGYRLDLFVEGEVIVEIDVKRLKDGGIHRLVQGDPPSPPPP